MNTNDAAIAVALAHWGIARLLSYRMAPYLADGRLKTILDAFELPALPIDVVHQEGRRVSARVRTLVDFPVDRLRADPGLN
jgi:DNA-binding transcriptional LysR family regulator